MSYLASRTCFGMLSVLYISRRKQHLRYSKYSLHNWKGTETEKIFKKCKPKRQPDVRCKTEIPAKSGLSKMFNDPFLAAYPLLMFSMMVSTQAAGVVPATVPTSPRDAALLTKMKIGRSMRISGCIRMRLLAGGVCALHALLVSLLSRTPSSVV